MPAKHPDVITGTIPVIVLWVWRSGIDAGPPDPQYNDRDGTRNDIGMFGGHNFIPDGRTTNKPIVLGLDIAPIAVPTGGTVTIESTGATVK